MNLSRSQLSLLITFFSMSLVVLLLYNIHLGGKEEEEYAVELSLADEDLEKIIEEEERKLEEQIKADPIKSHMAFNESAKPSYGNPEPLKTLEEIMEEKEALSDSETPTDFSDAGSGYAERIKELKEKRKEVQQKLGEKEASKEKRTNFAKRNTSVSYSMIDRSHIELPIPIYTCIEGGKIVINVVVNASGVVVDATVNEKSSSTLNGCLVDNARAYALKSQFEASSRASQKGSITYLFQGK